MEYFLDSAKLDEIIYVYTVWRFNGVTMNMSDPQLTKGNIAGGLTTIEEKAFGNIQKLSSLKYDGVFRLAEALEHVELVIAWLYRSA
jgi:altronate dehydratase